MEKQRNISSVSCVERTSGYPAIITAVEEARRNGRKEINKQVERMLGKVKCSVGYQNRAAYPSPSETR